MLNIKFFLVNDKKTSNLKSKFLLHFLTFCYNVFLKSILKSKAQKWNFKDIICALTQQLYTVKTSVIGLK